MDYDSFRAAWAHALRRSGLRRIDPYPSETLDTRTLQRSYETLIEPLGGQDAEPFHVLATVGFEWDALNDARGRVGDDGVLAELVGRDAAEELSSGPRFVRVELVLSARGPYGNPLPLPAPAAWQKWARETLRRLEDIEPLLPAERWRKTARGVGDVLAWRGAPKATVVCLPSGELRLEAVETSAGQLLDLPRVLADGDEPSTRTEARLRELFERLRAALTAWMQAVEHLRPPTREWETSSDDGAL
ncbi:MAG TPA: hypothetical protein VNN80_10480 [Polyangiaceae bacterium]|nr:hypothetical protein [Polyangiaceae bacterium]